MLKKIIYALRWRRVFNRTKRAMSYRANARLVIALFKMGALKRVA